MTRRYFCPTAFVDTPVGFDGQVARLAGGMTFFSACEVVTVEGGRRTALHLVPIDRIADVPGSDAAMARLTAPRAPLVLGERTIRLDQPQIATILNVTPDSFSDGGGLDSAEAAADAGFAAASAGAALIDVGGESTRPGAATIWEGDEVARVVPVVERLAAAGVAVSIDTRKAAVMEAALAAGAGLVNDVSALLFDNRAAGVIAKAGCPVILMHHSGTAKAMHDAPQSRDPLIETYDWLEARVEAAVAAGIDRAKIIVDPGIGFGKSLADNLALINGLALFQGLGCAVMLGASRKRVIGALSNEAPVGERLGGSVALALLGAARGAQLLRVHDTAETVQALRVWRGLRDAALTATL